MSILNVNKINPVGGGSTITIAGIASITNSVSVASSVTAGSFVGPIEGNVTGNVSGNADTASGLSGNPSINTTGIITATSFSGSGANLTGISAGITMYDTYHLTSNTNIDSNVYYLDSNFSRATGTGFGRIDLNGNGMTKSGQHFSFPATGLYEIRFLGIAYSNNTSRYINFGIMFNTAGTADSDYVAAAQATSAIPNDDALAYATGSAVFLFDVTNTSTHHVRFWTNVESSSTLQGTALSNGIRTSAIFKRIGDT